MDNPKNESTSESSRRDFFANLARVVAIALVAESVLVPFQTAEAKTESVGSKTTDKREPVIVISHSNSYIYYEGCLSIDERTRCEAALMSIVLLRQSGAIADDASASDHLRAWVASDASDTEISRHYEHM